MTADAVMSAVRHGSVIEMAGKHRHDEQQQQQQQHDAAASNTGSIISLPSIASSLSDTPTNPSNFRRMSTINDFELQNLCDNVFTQTPDPYGSRDAGFAPVSAFAAML